MYKKAISQSRLLRNRNANYNKKVSSTSVESTLWVNLFLIRSLNIPLNLLVESCQPAAISAFLNKARLEESSQILWLVVFEQSLYMPLEYLHTGCYKDRALPLYIDSNNCMEQWNQVETTFKIHTSKATVWKSWNSFERTNVLCGNS